MAEISKRLSSSQMIILGFAMVILTGSLRVFDSLIMKKVFLGPVKPIFFCQNFCFIV